MPTVVPGTRGDLPPDPEQRPAPPRLLDRLRVDVPLLVVLGILVVLTWQDTHPLSNSDSYFHLRFGELFRTGEWSLRHPGSVTTFGTADWVPTQWLPQVVMAQMESWFGLAGVVWLAGLLHVGLGVGLYFLARRWASPIAAAPVVVIALMAASPGISMRPQVITYLLVAVTASAWLASRQDRRPRWWLVPLTWVWAMCHGMWPIGLTIGVVALLGIALDRAVTRREWLRLALVPLLSAVAAGLTPVGPSLYSAVLLVNSRGKYFSEWQPPHFTSPYCLAFLILAAILLVRLLRRSEPSSWTVILLVLLAGGWALYTARTVMVAAMVLVPLAAAALQELLDQRRPFDRRELVVVLGGALACLTALAVVVPRTADSPPAEPSWASTLDDLPAGTVVLNDWGEGGYFMWRWPQLDLVMNGYGDIFTDAELERNFRMDATNPGWVDTVQGTGARYALLEPGSKLASGLADLEHWTVLHRSGDLELLIAPPGWPSPG